jgi:hypothetical protein
LTTARKNTSRQI